MENINNVVEAIIFSSGQPISKKDLCEKIPELTTQELNKIVKELQKKYSEDCVRKTLRSDLKISVFHKLR